MQRIDQNAGRGMIDIGDDPHRGLQVRNAGPGHEFEIGCQAVLCSRFAKLPVAIREPCQVRIVGRNENMFGAEARARLEEGREGRDVRLRPERDDFEIGDGHARRLQPLQRLSHLRRIVHQAIGNSALRRGQQSEPDFLVAAAGRQLDHLGRREIEHGQGGEREDGHQPKSAMRASSANMPW